jgi:hypothetical protein
MTNSNAIVILMPMQYGRKKLLPIFIIFKFFEGKHALKENLNLGF